LKKIIYYITDHGKGHASRSISVIRELQKHDIDVTVRNSNSIKFIQNSIPGINVLSSKTDVGISVKNDLLSIDKDKSKYEMTKWIESLNQNAEKEKEKIIGINPDLIISDISAMPFLVAKELEIPSIAISNFSWYDTSNFLEEPILEILSQAYDYASIAIKLPFGTPMTHFKNKYDAGIIARKTEREKKQIRKQIGINDSDFVVLFAMGNMVNEITCNSENNIKTLAMNSLVKNPNVINLSNWTEGQELVSISDLVICKSGYGMISECLINGTPFFYVSDNNRMELNMISNELSKIGLKNEITLEQINNLQLNQEFMNSIEKFEKKSNDTPRVTEKILEFIKN